MNYILFGILIVFLFWIVAELMKVSASIQDFSEEYAFYEDLEKAKEKLNKIEECCKQNANNSVENLKNRIKTILKENNE